MQRDKFSNPAVIAQPTTIYDRVGGEKTCRKLASAFYARVPRNVILRAVYPASSHCAVKALGAYFIQLLGGPNDYSRSRYWLSLREAHARFRIGEAQQEAWLSTMNAALSDIEIEEPVRQALRAFFARSSAELINHPSGDHPIQEDDPADSDRCFAAELAARWETQRTLDMVVASIRAKDHARALSLCGAPAFQDHLRSDRAAFAGVLAQMASSGNTRLREYFRQTLFSQPDLAHESYYNGRTLLHHASGGGDREFVELLLGLGADPNSRDQAGHTPLYTAGNERGNAQVVHRLADAGADVDAQDFVKRCAALHMAARRCNVPVAAALLDHGADIEIRDRNGETPLRRAVNCGKPQMAAFLLARGADPASKCNKALTPRDAARTTAMKQLFQTSKPEKKE